VSRQGVLTGGIRLPLGDSSSNRPHFFVMFLTLGSRRASEMDKSRSEREEAYKSELIGIFGADPVFVY
jgi:hypothetical protein